MTRRIDVEEALREREALLTNALRIAQMGTWVFDFQTERLTWSAQTCQLFGIAPADFPATLAAFVAMIVEEDRPRQLLAMSTPSGDFESEYRIRRPNGTLRWMHERGTVECDPSGLPVRRLGVVMDVTARKQAEALAKHSVFEQRFSSAVNSPVSGPGEELADITHRVDDVTDHARKHHSGEAAASDVQSAGRQQQLEADIVLRSQELARANERLAQNQTILRMAGSAGKLGGWFVTLANGMVTWSDETAIIHDEPAGFSPPIETAINYYAPEYRTLVRKSVEACVQHGTPFDIDAELITAKGRRVFVRAIGEPACNADGVVTHVQGAFQDVSTLRRAQETLRESEKRFRLLAKATNDAIWDWNVIAQTLWWNEGFTTLLGSLPAESEPTFKAWQERVHQEDRDRVLASIQSAMEGGAESLVNEYRFMRNDGSYAYVLDRGHMIRDDSGIVVRVIGGITDLTERKRAEEKLREQARLLDGASNAILVCDLEQRIHYWNRGAEQLYGWTMTEALGRLVGDLLYGPDKTALLTASQTTVESGEWNGEIEQVTKEGRTVTVLARWTLLRDEAGQPRSILVINTDVTERKQLEQQLLRAQRMESIGTLAGGIAHDLNNVLAPILMSCMMLQDGESDPGRLADLRTIETCTQRGAAMLRQLLSFARGGGGRRTRTDLWTIAVEVQSIIRDTFPKDISVQLNAAPQRSEMDADPTQMHQLLMNLCVNARDAMPNGGTLTLSIEDVAKDDISGMSLDAEPGTYLLLQVEDTGTGMAPEVLERIFDPFFTTKETGKGTGLGLSTAHAIVRSHHGFMHVHSELGQGTRFMIYFPADMRPTASDGKPVAPLTLPRGNDQLILVVDDEESIRRVVRRTLEKYGYRVLVATNGNEAVALYAQYRHEIAVVLTDMNMPVMEGAATISALKALNPELRIVGSSGLNANSNVAKAVDAGAHAFVAKPYTAETLLRVLETTLRERH